MTTDTDKLYRVTLRGMQTNMTGTAFGVAYVMATNPTDAYQVVRDRLDHDGTGFEKEREMQSVELIAEMTKYPDCGYRLYFAER